jgi:hypothetical protein
MTHLQDFNSNENTLRVQWGGAGWSGLGRTLEQDHLPILVANDTQSPPIVVASNEAEAYTAFEDVTHSSVPVVPRTVGPALQLPQFNFATGVSSCTSCDTDLASKVAAANAAAVVTPMPAAPKSINWLLIAGGLGLGYFFLRGGASGLGSPAPEPTPAPVVQDLGRPPRKPKAKPKHVASLSI